MEETKEGSSDPDFVSFRIVMRRANKGCLKSR